jgi:hypothetical protein
MPVLGCRCPYHPAIPCPISLATEKKLFFNPVSTISLFFLGTMKDPSLVLRPFFLNDYLTLGVISTKLFCCCLIGYPYTSQQSQHRPYLSLCLSSLCNPASAGCGRRGQSKKCHCKKRLAVFPSPAGMSLIKLFLAGNNLIIPGFRRENC